MIFIYEFRGGVIFFHVMWLSSNWVDVEKLMAAGQVTTTLPNESLESSSLREVMGIVKWIIIATNNKRHGHHCTGATDGSGDQASAHKGQHA
jgi:hypothetical protein